MFVPCNKNFLEGRQPKRIAPVLYPKEIHEKAVHAQHDRAPRKNRHLLHRWVGHPWNFESKRNGRKRKNPICATLAEHDPSRAECTEA